MHMHVSKSKILILPINENDFITFKIKKKKNKSKYFCISYGLFHLEKSYTILQHTLTKELKLFSLYTNSANIR